MSDHAECDAMREDHFGRFGLEPEFDLDAQALEQAYFALQRQCHPDRVATRSETERLRATQQAMTVNEGYHILKNPLTRAEYLLARHGVVVSRDHATVKPSGCLLIEMMELREKLAEATDPSEIEAIKQDARQQIAETTEKLSRLFVAEQWEDAAQSTIRLRYLVKITEAIRRKQQVHKV